MAAPAPSPATSVTDLVASIIAPAETCSVDGPKQIWRAHGTKSVFVPPTLGSSAAEGDDASAAAAPTALKIVQPVEIDEAQFVERVTVVALRIAAKKCGVFQSHFKLHPHMLMSRARIGTIVDGPAKDSKYLLLSLKSFEELATLPQATLELCAKEGAQAVLFTFVLDYEYFTQDHILKALLPAGMQIPAGFETIGHIAHLNLSEEQRPYGPIVARVILDKSPHLHTVVNKLGAIASEFRVFDMEVLAGVDSFLAEVREHNCTFLFDFSKVYWNSRLSTEHSRLIDLFQPRQLIVDLMCGIGPFVVPAAKKLAKQNKFLGGSPAILANDLNPDSYKYLVQNLERNKVAPCVAAHNLDGRAFLWDILRPAQTKKSSPYFQQPAAHLVMNLPAIAVEFLDAFVGLYADGHDDGADPQALLALQSSNPLVHVYCFSRSVDDPLSDLVPRIERALGGRTIPPAEFVKDTTTNQQQPHAAQKKAKKQAQALRAKQQQGSVAADSSASAEAAAASSSSASASPSPVASLPPIGATHIRFVRNVAPSKDMFCVSFHVPREVLAATDSWKKLQDREQAAKNGDQPMGDATSSSTSASAPDATAASAKRKLGDVQASAAAAEEDAQPAKKSKE